MFRSRRRFPMFGWLFVALLVYLLLRGLGGATAGVVGLAFLLPVLLFKMLFFFLIMGAIMGKFGGGPRHYGGARRRESDPLERDPEWERNVREARTELDELFPDEA